MNSPACCRRVSLAFGARVGETLTARDVACVEVAAGPTSRAVIEDPVAPAPRTFSSRSITRHSVATSASPLSLLSRNRGRPGAAPLLGAHTEPVLREIGCDDEAILALERTGVVRLEPSLLARRP